MSKILPFKPREDYAEPPHNLEAEQVLLGSLLAYPEAWTIVADKLKPEHFHEPLHARIYAKAMELSTEGRFVSPVILKSHLEGDEALAQVGGMTYLSRLIGSMAGPLVSISDYAELVRSLSDRRLVIDASSQMKNFAADETDNTEFRKGLSAHIADLMSTFENGSRRKSTYTMQEAGGDALRRLEGLSSGAPDPHAVQSGVPEIDRMTGGFRRGEYIVIGARPSMGKTAKAVQLALNVASRGGGVAYFSLEMPTPILFPQFWASRLWTPGAFNSSYQDILRGNVAPERRRYLAQVVEELQGWPIIIDDEPGLSAHELEARARVIGARLRSKGGNLDLVIVDHIHKMHSPGAQNRVAEYSEISAALAEAAKRLNAPLVALAQLSRGVEGREDKRPTLSDLRESGAIEQDADTVAFLYRPGYYLERQRGKDSRDDIGRVQQLAACSHSLEFILAKQRSGPIGTVDLWADMASNVILDRSEAPE